MDKEVIITWISGNPGAMSFIAELLEDENKKVAEIIISKLKQSPYIRGTSLYVLWSDLCEKELKNVEKLVLKCPKEILEDACSRQDYSGRKLVAEYLK